MNAHPDDLDLIIKHEPSGEKLSGAPGFPLVAAFLRIAEELEPTLVWTDATTRVQWRLQLEQLRYRLERWINHDYSRSVSGEPAFEKNVLRDLAKLAHEAWRGPSRGPRREFPFVRNGKLREIAERDFGSLTSALQHEEIKVALVLAGSVIEAILLDLTERDPAATTAAAQKVKGARSEKEPAIWRGFQSDDQTHWKLAQIIGVCGPAGLGILSDRAEKIAGVVRDWRNFVHPRKEREDTVPLLLSDATVATALVDRVLEEVSAWATPTNRTG